MVMKKLKRHIALIILEKVSRLGKYPLNFPTCSKKEDRSVKEKQGITGSPLLLTKKCYYVLPTRQVNLLL